jgi:ParB family transcriptional regulator, chromosome partitioning protein
MASKSIGKGLGRGLDVFFGDDKKELENITTAKKDKNKELDKVIELNITEVEPTLNQPRKVFDKEKLQELADSIKEHGVLQPILVVKDDNGYTIVAGERRWRASKMAGLKVIPAIIKDYTDSKKKQVALIENIQREDLNIVEVAKAIKELMDIDGYTQSEVAKITGKNLSTVSNIMRLLKLQDIILENLMDGKIVEGHARALLAVEDKQKQLDILEKILERKLTVRDTEKLVYGAEDYNRGKNKKEPKSIYYQKIENKLKEYFGYKVKLEGSKDHQKLVIEYNDEEGLEYILSKIKIRL